MAKELNIALALDETWITRDGRFAASFEIDGDLAATPSEKGQVMRKIARVVTRNGVWLRRMPNSLDFESRRQLRSLKAAAKTLPAEDQELLELTITPKGPVLAALAQGCAELIRSGATSIPRGKEEYTPTGPGVVIFVASGILVGGILGALGAEFAFDELLD